MEVQFGGWNHESLSPEITEYWQAFHVMASTKLVIVREGQFSTDLLKIKYAAVLKSNVSRKYILFGSHGLFFQQKIEVKQYIMFTFHFDIFCVLGV